MIESRLYEAIAVVAIILGLFSRSFLLFSLPLVSSSTASNRKLFDVIERNLDSKDRFRVWFSIGTIVRNGCRSNSWKLEEENVDESIHPPRPFFASVASSRKRRIGSSSPEWKRRRAVAWLAIGGPATNQEPYWRVFQKDSRCLYFYDGGEGVADRNRIPISSRVIPSRSLIGCRRTAKWSGHHLETFVASEKSSKVFSTLPPWAHWWQSFQNQWEWSVPSG